MFTRRERYVMENPIIYKALERLKEQTGIVGKWKPYAHLDGRLELKLPNGNLQFVIEARRELRQYQFPQLLELARHHEPLLIVANHIFPAIKEQLREHKIGYLDGAGNIYVNTGNQFIWIDGHKTTEEKLKTTNRAFTKTGLKTVFYLLLHPEAVNYTYRKLAHATETALGNIKNVIEGLTNAGYILRINDHLLQLQNKRELLDRWVTGYGETLKPTILAGAYKFWNIDKFVNWQDLDLVAGEDFWGGEPAGDLLTNYLTPLKLTLYTTNEFKVVRKWTLIPDDNGPLLIYKKFWREEDADRTNRVVPPLLVYADLMLINDPRCRETAEKVYKKYLQNGFE